MRLFVDMDGTLSRFHEEKNYLERMYEKDFFKNLKPYKNLICGLRLFAENNPQIKIYILSSGLGEKAPYCIQEKHEWCITHIPFIPYQNRIIIPPNRNKVDFVPYGIKSDDILIDDYNENLNAWVRSGGKAIKCVNEFNNKSLQGESFDGIRIYNCPCVNTIVDINNIEQTITNVFYSKVSCKYIIIEKVKI